jgi:HTH-type transcriptional regulator, competence development regulator
MAIGDQIKRVRERKVWGQAELARKAGISPNTLYRIEAGDHDPRPITIRKIAEALGVDPGELVSGSAAP